MKRIALLAVMLTGVLNAHNLWVVGGNSPKVNADIVYGHNFPVPEEIQKERVELFAPVEILGKNSKITLTQKGKNYHFEGKKPLKNGTYIVKSYYYPTAWIKKDSGKWEMKKTRKDTKEKVLWCGVSSMLAKSIISINDDGSYAKKPLKKDFEITPMVKASDIKFGKKVKFKLTLDGKPVKLKEVFGGFKEYSNDEMSYPFYAKTNLKGEFEFTPLKKGLWYLKSTLEKDTKDKDCEIRLYKTSLSFNVK